MNRKDMKLLKHLGACSTARIWAKGVKDLHEAWNTCLRADWMLWLLEHVGYKDDKVLRLYACACVRGTPLGDGRTEWDLLTDVRSRTVVEVAERYAIGEASIEELAAARTAAKIAARTAAKIAARTAVKIAPAAVKIAPAAAWAAAWTAALTAPATKWAATWAAQATPAAAAAAQATPVALAAALLWQANLLRQYVPWSAVETALIALSREE